MSDKEQQASALVKALFLGILELQERVTAFELILKEKGIVTPLLLDGALVQAKKVWADVRKKIEEIDPTVEQEQISELLGKVGGLVQ